MKNSRIVAIILAVIMLFAGCSNNRETAPEDENSTLDFSGNDLNVIDVNEFMDSVDSAEGNPDRPMEEVLAEMGAPSTGFALFNSLEDTDSFILEEYNGGEIEFYLQAAVGIESQNFNLGVLIDGILQDCKIERDGVASEYKKLHAVTIEKATSHIYKVTVRPNTGKAGETVLLQGFAQMNPDFRVKSESEYYDYGNMLITALGFASVKMNVDAVNLTDDVCKNYSRVKVNTYNPMIGEIFAEKSSEHNITATLIYTDLNSAVWYDDSLSSVEIGFLVKADRTENCPIHIALGGIDYDTTQRISVYVNGKIMPVFDGKYYADVPVSAGKQTDIDITLDTTSLDEWSNIRVTHYNLTENGAMRKDLSSSFIYTLRVAS